MEEAYQLSCYCVKKDLALREMIFVVGIACYVLPSMHYSRRIDVISSGGRYAVSHDDKTIQLWDVEEGQQVASFTADKVNTGFHLVK